MLINLYVLEDIFSAFFDLANVISGIEEYDSA